VTDKATYRDIAASRFATKDIHRDGDRLPVVDGASRDEPRAHALPRNAEHDHGRGNARPGSRAAPRNGARPWSDDVGCLPRDRYASGDAAVAAFAGASWGADDGRT